MRRNIRNFLIGAVYAIALIWVVAYKFKQPELALTGLLVSIIAFTLVLIVFLVYDALDKLETKKKSKA
ncbi:MAG: hypothetical protein Q8N63_02690 [Nanoarchaeota archaeon]|nr:hypothetical protein [Nanoarchaeota archaeon]